VNKINGELLQEKLHQLRKSFDEVIAKPIETGTRAYTKYMAFSLGHEFFALPVSDIKEVLVNQRIILLPVKDKAVHGVVNYKNEILSVINLHYLLGLSSIEAGQANSLLLIRGSTVEAFLLVNTLVAILAIPDDAIQPKPICLDQDTGEMIIGEFYHQEQLITLLNAHSITDSKEDEDLVR